MMQKRRHSSFQLCFLLLTFFVRFCDQSQNVHLYMHPLANSIPTFILSMPILNFLYFCKSSLMKSVCERNGDVLRYSSSDIISNGCVTEVLSCFSMMFTKSFLSTAWPMW